MTYLYYPQAKELAYRAVEERGADFVYPDEWTDAAGACLYRNPERPTQPGCLVGMVASYLGVLGLMTEGAGVKDAFGAAGVSLDYRTEEFLSEAQNLQDGGAAWGDAVETAVNYAESREE